MSTRPDAAGTDPEICVYLWLINWFQPRKEFWPRIETDETRFRKPTQGIRNTANGYQALLNNSTGSNNTANGLTALFGNTGSNNTAVGVGAGSSLITGGNADAVNVVIDFNGQFGTASSSRRFKKEIKPMDQISEAILALKPVTFHYTSHMRDTPQFGIIAEEVAKVNPDLVVRDKDGKPYSVRYDQVNAMLLNEFLKERRKVQELGKGTEVLTAQLKAQAAQIQKVSAQLEVGRLAPQTVLNNQ